MKLVAILSFMLALSLTTQAQNGSGSPETLTTVQTSALNEAQTLNREMISLYQQQKYDDALKLGLRIRSLIDQNGIFEHRNSLTLLSNVAEVMLAKGKEGDAIALYQRILAAWQKTQGPDSLPEAQVTDRIARAFFAKDDYKRAEEYGLRSLAIYEKRAGAVSIKVAAAQIFLGGIYHLERKFEQADAAYLKGIAINDQAMNQAEKIARTDLDDYICFIYHLTYGPDRAPEIVARAAEFRRLRAEREQAGRPVTVVASGVVNGKAIDLVKPVYPANLRSLGNMTGFVVVEVEIDEVGKVTKAKGTCGIRNFLRASEEAALKSRFSPTSLSGVPVKVTGVIIYHFGGQSGVPR